MFALKLHMELGCLTKCISCSTPIFSHLEHIRSSGIHFTSLFYSCVSSKQPSEEGVRGLNSFLRLRHQLDRLALLPGVVHIA